MKQCAACVMQTRRAARQLNEGGSAARETGKGGGGHSPAAPTLPPNEADAAGATEAAGQVAASFKKRSAQEKMRALKSAREQTQAPSGGSADGAEAATDLEA